MKNDQILDAFGALNDEAIADANACQRPKTNRWLKWGAMAACVCLLVAGGIHISRYPAQPITTPLEADDTPSIEDPPSAPASSSPENQTFIPVSALLTESNSGYFNQALEISSVPVGQYDGLYEKIHSVGSDILRESTGTLVPGTETWYRISGHDDLQYLIQKNSGSYSLWKFMCFDSDEYAYQDVLETVYKIDSAHNISEIKVHPATMDNTNAGKAIQAEIGSQTITGEDEIKAIYEILCTLTCYGENNWDKINLGSTDAAVDQGTSHEAVWSGRYLTFVTDYGNEIDGLKYTAASNIFYEYYGIAYNQLTAEQARIVHEILKIEPARGE